MVADVEAYPEFLPWVAGVRVLEQGEEKIIAETLVRFKGFRGKYTSQVALKKPDDPQQEGQITVQMVEGPFTHLTTLWHFMPQGEGTLIDFHIDFAFRSRVLEKMIGAVFNRKVEAMVDAFEARADILYR